MLKQTRKNRNILLAVIILFLFTVFSIKPIPSSAVLVTAPPRIISTGEVTSTMIKDDEIVSADIDNTAFIQFGRVLVGTSTPGALLYVQSGTTTVETLLSVVDNASTTLLHLSNGGHFGLGTTSPGALFSVHGSGLFSSDLSIAGLTATGTVSLSDTTKATIPYASTTALTVSGLLNLDGGATTTADNGVDISAGCFAKSGTCIGDETWGLLFSTTTETAMKVATVPFTSKTDLHIVIDVPGLANANNLRIQFNDDTAANYNYSVTDCSGQTAVTGDTGIHLSKEASTSSPRFNYDLRISNNTAKRKYVYFTGGMMPDADTQPCPAQGAGLWDNTSAQISSIQVYSYLPNESYHLDVGSRITVYGY